MADMKLYIVDDSKIVCESLQFLFDSLFEFPVTIYANPLQFLEECSPAWRGCLIVDLFMPIMNGIDFVRKVKTINQHLKIIIISGHGNSKVAQQSLDVGANAFINKPFKVNFLLETIKEICHFPQLSKIKN